MTKHVFYVGDALAVLKTLPAESVHCVVTSPPYWGLRDYGVEGQLGLEAVADCLGWVTGNPCGECYVCHMVQGFREVRRVLRQDGTLWLNLGDCFAGSTMSGGSGSTSTLDGSHHRQRTDSEKLREFKRSFSSGLKPKDLYGIPWRVAFALQADGWWLRSDIIWHKPNPLPESVTDRPTKAHEHVFLLAKSERYFYDAEAIKEEAVADDIRAPNGSPGIWEMDGRPPEKRNSGKPRKQDAVGKNTYVGFNDRYQPVLKRNKRDVWIIPTQPFPGAHFATFPEALVEPCILAGTSEYGCCPKCGAPWERITRTEHKPHPSRGKMGAGQFDAVEGTYVESPTLGTALATETLGWRPTCSCGIEETIPCTVLDPFGGAGTVSLVAKRLGRNSIYIDLSPDYCDMAIRRLEPEKQPLFDSCEVRREVIA